MPGIRRVATGDRPAIAVKRMPANGTTLAYVDQGRGTPVVFVHGAVSDHRLWEPQRDACARSYRFIAFDQRYYGVAPWPDDGGSFCLRTRIDDLAAFLRALDAGPAHLVGWSMSAGAVIGVAMAHPELVRSVFVHEPSLRGLTLDAERTTCVADDLRGMLGPALAALRAGDGEDAVRRFFDGADDRPGAFDGARAAMQAMAFDNARTLPLQLAEPAPPPLTCRQLRGIPVPVAISSGAETRAYYRVVAEALCRCLRHGHAIVVPGARHLWPLQSPAAFNEALLGFIARCTT